MLWRRLSHDSGSSRKERAPRNGDGTSHSGLFIERGVNCGRVRPPACMCDERSGSAFCVMAGRSRPSGLRQLPPSKRCESGPKSGHPARDRMASDSAGAKPWLDGRLQAPAPPGSALGRPSACGGAIWAKANRHASWIDDKAAQRLGGIYGGGSCTGHRYSRMGSRQAAWDLLSSSYSVC
jgi:hypothetical protein